MSELLEALGDPLADAFFGVGVLIALMLALMGMARARWGSQWDRWLTRFPQAGPAVAALLSLPPGCSGVIVTVALYAERRVTYGTVVAALLATMGDSAWVLIAFDPLLALQLKAVFLVVGAVGGYLVDLARIEPRAHSGATTWRSDNTTTVGVVSTPSRNEAGKRSDVRVLPVTSAPPTFPAMSQPPPVSGPGRSWWEMAEPCCINPADTSSRDVDRRSDGFVLAFWIAIIVGIVFAIPTEFLGVQEDTISGFAGSHTFLGVGVAGFVVAAAVAVRGRLHRRNCHCVDTASIRVILRHTAFRAATMVSIVGVVSMLLAIITELTGFEPGSLPFYGILGIVVGAALGLLPSCGLEVVMASLFVAGGLPLAALLAYLVSHDGAGLIPLYAVHRRSALISTVLTTVPAILVGLVALTLT